MQSNGYTPTQSTNNWTNGSYGISTRYQNSTGHGLSITHHTPESHHYTEGKKSITVPDNARKIRIGNSVVNPGAGMAPMMAIGDSAGAPVSGNVGEGIYGGQNSLIAGAPPMT
jgi:hypothetical protein